MSNPSVPFADPPWLNGLPSPYYNDSHRQWQKNVRAFVTENLGPHLDNWNEDAVHSTYKKFMQANMIIPSIGAPLPVKALKKAGIHTLLGGLKVEDFDYTHCAVHSCEMVNSGLLGPASALFTGLAYGTPAVIKYGSQELQDRILPDIFNGNKRICLAITEPDAGSDVANIKTTAKKSKDGKYYIVDGAKKWITNAIWSDYATMAVRTGGKGASGLSMLIVPLKSQGVEMRKMSVMGGTSGGTTYVELDEVKVPVENLLGQEGQGMRMVMTNFNHERLVIALQAMTQARAALSMGLSYVMKREAFGQPLFNQPVVRHRIAKCGADLEALSSWVESFVYQMTQLPKERADKELGGLTAAAKAKAGIVLHDCTECAVLLFGGNGLTDSGQGGTVTAIWREIPGARIPGGSEDVLLDLMVRELVKNYKKKMEQVEKNGSKL